MKNRGKGFALITVLFVLAILFIFCATLFQMTAFQQTRQQADWKLEQAKAIAHAGITKGILYLEENGLKELPDESTLTKSYSWKENYSGGSFTVNLEYVPVSKRIDLLPWKISSTGTFQGRKAQSSTMADGYDPLRKIVLFGEGSSQLTRQSVSSRHGTLLSDIPEIDASVVILNAPEDKISIIMEPGVIGVDNDARVVLASTQRLFQTIPFPTRPVSDSVPWGIDRIGATKIWSKSTGKNVKVAVVDTGSSPHKYDLKITGGVNIISRNASSADDNGHGTHVAGTIAAMKNRIGVIGAAYDASIYSVKVLNSMGSGSVSNVIQGLTWSMSNKMQVVNMSLGSTSNVSALAKTVALLKKQGVIIVAAAGNSGASSDGKSSVLYPAAYPEVIAVSALNGAYDVTRGIAKFSSVGPEVDLIAPGTYVISTYLNDSWAMASGTSMAAPHVTAACALKLAVSPKMTPDQMMEKLKATATSIPGLTSNQQGAGLVNAYKLVNN